MELAPTEPAAAAGKNPLTISTALLNSEGSCTLKVRGSDGVPDDGVVEMHGDEHDPVGYVRTDVRSPTLVVDVVHAECRLCHRLVCHIGV